jgi:hypothetical protein
MWLTSKTVQAVLRDRKLRRCLLRDKELSEAEYRSYDHLDQEKQDIAAENVINALEAYAPVQVFFPSPVDQYPDDAKVFGARGVYMVCIEGNRKFFSTKRAAMQLATSVSRVSWAIAKEMGYLDEQDQSQ